MIPARKKHPLSVRPGTREPLANPCPVVSAGKNNSLSAPVPATPGSDWSIILPVRGYLAIDHRGVSLIADVSNALVLEGGAGSAVFSCESTDTRWITICPPRGVWACTLSLKGRARYRVAIPRSIEKEAPVIWQAVENRLATPDQEIWASKLLSWVNSSNLRLLESFRELPPMRLERKHQLGLGLLRARDYLESNFSERLSVDELAQISGMSRSYFVRLFKLFTHQTPMHYLAEVRLLEARRILCEGFFRIQDVALAVGYENRSSFVRAFSRRFGYPPGQCRPEMLSGRSATSELTESNTAPLAFPGEYDL